MAKSKSKYLVKTRIIRGNKPIEVGSEVEFSSEDAAHLLKIGAIEPASPKTSAKAEA